MLHGSIAGNGRPREPYQAGAAAAGPNLYELREGLAHGLHLPLAALDRVFPPVKAVPRPEHLGEVALPQQAHLLEVLPAGY